MSDKYSGLSRESLIAKLIAMENDHTVLNDKYKEIKSLNRNLKEQKSQLLKENNGLIKDINSKENKITQQNKELKNKEREIKLKNKTIENKDKLIKNKENKIQELEEINTALKEEALAVVNMLRFYKLDNIASKLEGITEYVDFMRMQNNVIINIATQHEELRKFLFGKGINHNFNAIRDESSIIFEDHSNSGESTPKLNENEGNGANEGKGSDTSSPDTGSSEDKPRKRKNANEMLLAGLGNVVARAKRFKEEHPECSLSIQTLASLDDNKRPEDNDPKPTTPPGKNERKLQHLPSNNKSPSKLEEEIEAILSKWKCPNCGSTKEPDKLYNAIDKGAFEVVSLFSVAFEQETPAQKDTGCQLLVCCKECGFNDLIEAGTLRILPDRSLSIDLVLFVALMQINGLAVNAANRIFLSSINLGHSTLYNNVLLVGLMFKPLYNLIEDKLDSSEVNIFDETTYRIIESRTTEEGTTKNISNKKYMVMRTTPKGSGDNLILIYSPGRRSAVKNIVHDYLKQGNKSIVSDAFPSYISASEENQSPLQLCLAHLYRKFRDVLGHIQPIDPDDDKIEAILSGISNRKNIEDNKGLNQIFAAEDAVLLRAAASLLQQIFEWEDYAQKQAKGDYQRLLIERQAVRQQHSVAIMKKFDIIMDELAKTHLVEGPKGGLKKLNNQNLLSNPVYYYQHNKEHFKTFLNHPNLPVTSSQVEQVAKFIATVRNSSLFSRTYESAEAISILLSVYHTVVKNGIEFMHFAHEYVTYVRNHMVQTARLKASFKGQRTNTRFDYANESNLEGLVIPKGLIPWLIQK